MEDERIFHEYTGPRNIADLTNFPFTKFEDLTESVWDRKFTIGINRTFMGITVSWFSAGIWRRSQLLIAGFLGVWSLALLYVAADRGLWWLLLGIPIAWVGLVCTGLNAGPNTHRRGNILSIVYACIAVCLCLATDYWAALIPISFPLFYVLKRLAVWEITTRLRLKALDHERWFCLLYHSRTVSLRNNATGETYTAEPFELRPDSQAP